MSTQSSDRPFLVVVAATVEDRRRLLSRVGDLGPVLFVASACEAHAALQPWVELEHVRHEVDSIDAAPEDRLRLAHDLQALVVDEHEVSLTPLEFALMRCLLHRRGRAVSHADLGAQVWGSSHVGDASQVHAVVKRLRRKLTEVSAPVELQAIRAVGFRLVPCRRVAHELPTMTS